MFFIIFINNLLFVSFCCFYQSLEEDSQMTTGVVTNLIAKMASIDYVPIISRSLSYSRLCRFAGVSLAPGFYLPPECTTVKVSLSILSPCVHLGNPIYHVPIRTDPPILPKVSLLFHPRLGSPCYLATLQLWIVACLSFTLQLLPIYK